MKYLLVSISLLCVHVSFSQNYFLPDTFSSTKGVKQVDVIRECVQCKIKTAAVIEIFYFNDDGRHVSTKMFDSNGELSGIKNFFYKEDGVMDYYQRFKIRQWENRKSKTIIKDTLLLHEVRYDYDQGLLVSACWLEGIEKILFEQVKYSYDENRFCVKEEFSNYSISWADTGAVIDSIVTQRKHKRYIQRIRERIYDTSVTVSYKTFSKRRYDGNVIVEYFIMDDLKGMGLIMFNKERKIVKENVSDDEQKKGYIRKFVYDSIGNVVSMSLYDEGLDGFGNAHDVSTIDRVDYLYDEKNRLSSETKFAKDKIWAVYSYSYK